MRSRDLDLVSDLLLFCPVFVGRAFKLKREFIIIVALNWAGLGWGTMRKLINFTVTVAGWLAT